MSGVLITAVFTLLTPVAARAGLPFLYAVRIIEVTRVLRDHDNILLVRAWERGSPSPPCWP